MNNSMDPSPIERNPSVARERGAKRWDDSRFNWRAWREQHLYSMMASLGRLWQNLGATCFTVAVVGLALALPLLLALAVRNLQGATTGMQSSSDLTVFLKPSVDNEQAESLLKTWSKLPEVHRVQLQSPDDGLRELRDLPGFGSALDALDRNPLPSVIHLMPKDLTAPAMTKLAQRIETESSVDFVQYDQAWFDRLQSVLNVIKRLAWLIAILLGLGAVLIVGNTIRMDVSQRAEEIRVMQSLGASLSFVRRPHLYAGFWYGLAGAILALIITIVVVFALQKPVQHWAKLYESGYQLRGLTLVWAFITLVMGGGIGLLGARFASSQQIASTRLQ